jgi:hypothetical protein
VFRETEEIMSGASWDDSDLFTCISVNRGGTGQGNAAGNVKREKTIATI